MRHWLAATIFAAASALGAGAGAQPVEIRVQYAQPGLFKDSFDEITRQFMAANPDVRINMLAPPPGYAEILAAHLRDALTGQIPDVGCHGMFNQRVLAERGLAQPLDALIAQDPNWRSYGFSDAALSLGRIGGRQVALGFSMSMPTIYYNANLVRAAGGDPDRFPDSWDAIIDLARRMHNPAERRTGIFLSWQIVGNWMWQALVSSHGGNQLSDDEKRVAFDQPAGQQALRLLARLVSEANMPDSNYPAASQDFFGGRLGILIDSSAQLGNITRTVGQAFPVRTAPMPRPAGQAARLPVGGMACLMFARDPARQRAAWRFMTFASGPQGATIMVRNTGYVPLTDVPRNTPDMLGNFYRDNPNHAVTLQQMSIARDWYAFPGANGARINDVIRDHLQAVVNRSQQPDAVMRAMVTDVQALLPR
jgi:multiple sugar transport system substrate-binding protein